LRYREPAISLQAVVEFIANPDKRELVAAKRAHHAKVSDAG